MCKRFYACFDFRYGYPDFTYLSRVKSELAAKGIGSTSTSFTSASVTTAAASAKLTMTTTAFSTSVTSKTSSHMSSKLSANSYASDAEATTTSAAGRIAVHRTSSLDHNRYSASHVKASSSSSVPSAHDNTSQYGADRTKLSYHDPYPSLPLSSSSYVSRNTNGARSLHSMSRLDGTSVGPSGSASLTMSYPYTPSTYSTSGQRTCISRQDDRDRQQVSGAHHSSTGQTYQHSAVSRTGVYDTNRRYD